MDITEKNIEIPKTFYKRYFEKNALVRISYEMLSFLWYKKGSFINPLKKNEVLNKYIDEEIENFYGKNLLILPQIEFCITTKCTLKCKDCCALIPELDKRHRMEMSFDDFKLYFDTLINNVDGIRRFVILGGETLMHPELVKMIEYAVSEEKITCVELITNGTILPKQDLIDCIKKSNGKVLIYISNYKDNLELTKILKTDEIEKIFRENNIKYQKLKDNHWYKEGGFSDSPDDKETTKEKLINCYRMQCNQVINGFLYICSKASAGEYLMGGGISDGIDIINSKNLRKELIDFYNKQYFDACSYCVKYDENVQPALQI